MNPSQQNDIEDAIDPLSNYEPINYPNEMQRALMEENVSQIDSRPMMTIGATASVREAVAMLNDARASSLLVTKENKLVGIFTERDVLEKIAEQYDRVCDKPICEFMTSNPTIVYQSDPSATAAAAISVAGHRHVPVIDLQDDVQGIISPRRFFRFMERHFQCG